MPGTRPSNGTICSLLSSFYSANFQFVACSYWEANSHYPRGLIVRKESFTKSAINEIEGFQSLGPSNGTICSLLAHFVLTLFNLS